MATCIFIEDMTIGLERSRSKVVTKTDISLFGDVSGDRNPVHFDEDYAAQTPFGGVIAHGMIAAGLISAVIGEELPGPGAIYMGQDLRFLRPVRPGDEVVTVCRVDTLFVEKRRVILDCVCAVQGKTVVEGKATVLAPSRAALRKAA